MAIEIDIKKLGLDPKQEEALQQIGNKDDRLEKSEIDTDNDGYLDLAGPLLQLSPEEFGSVQSKLYDANLITKMRGEPEIKVVLLELKDLLADPNQISDIVNTVFSETGYFSGDTLETLPAAIKTLQNTGLDNSNIVSLVKEIVTRGRGNSYEILQEIPAFVDGLKENGIDDPGDILNILTAVIKVRRENETLVYLSLKELPPVISYMMDCDISVFSIAKLISTINTETASKSALVIERLPKTIESLVKYDIDSPKEIVDIISTIVVSSGPRSHLVMDAIPLLISGLASVDIDDSSDISLMIKTVVSAAGPRTPEALANLPKILDELDKLGIDDINKRAEIVKIIISITNKVDLPELFEVFPKVVSDLMKYNFKDAQAVIDLIRPIIAKAERTNIAKTGSFTIAVIKKLPTLVKGLSDSCINDPRDITDIINSAIEVCTFDINLLTTFVLIEESLKAMTEVGIEKKDIKEIITAVIKSARQDVDGTLSSLRMTLDIMIAKDIKNSEEFDIANILKYVAGLGDLCPAVMDNLELILRYEIEGKKDLASVRDYIDPIINNKKVAPIVVFENMSAPFLNGIRDPEEIINILYSVTRTNNINWSGVYIPFHDLLEICKSDPDLIINFIDSIANIAKEDTLLVLNCVSVMMKAGITDTADIVNFVDEIYRLSEGKLSNTLFELENSLKVILDCGITNAAQVKELVLKIIVTSDPNSDAAMKALRKTLKSLITCGIKNPDDLIGLLTNICTSAELYSFLAFEALPEVISDLKDCGIRDPGLILEFLNLAVTSSRDYSSRTFLASCAALSYLNHSNQDPAETNLRLLERIIEASKDSSPPEALLAIPAIISAGIKDPEQIIALVEHVTASTAYMDGAFDALSAMLAGTTIDSETEFDTLKQNAGFLIKYSGSKTSLLSDIFNILKLDVFNCSREQFVPELVKKMKIYADEQGQDEEIYEKVAVLINTIHDEENDFDGTDLIRTGIAAGLSPKSAYMLISLGGSDLYTSTFLKIWRAQKVVDIKSWLTEVDPTGKHLAGFILQLCCFDQTELFAKNAPFFLDKTKEILLSKENVAQKGGLLIKLLDKVLPTVSDEDKKKFADSLAKLYYAGELQSQRGVAAYLIKCYEKKSGLGKLSPELKKIADETPKILEPSIPADTWLSDGTITAKAYFYKDELQWYNTTIEHYRKLGWGQDKDYMRKNNLSGKEYAVFKKTVNGVTCRVILTKATPGVDNRMDSINNPEIDIVVHRGHSYHLKETFPAFENTGSSKLIIGGSCGSFRTMTSNLFLKRYANHYLIADTDTGEGNVNCELLDTVMSEVAKGCTSWDCLKKFKEYGIILPNDPSLTIVKYLIQLKSLQAGSK